ncbi:MAG: MarR family winged helix-turn-helix transcriptional regulator [Velocimicrobium sp.]
MQEEISNLINKYYDDWFEINKLYYVWAKKHNISQKALFVLLEILNMDTPCIQTSICEHTSYPKQTVSKILNNLERQGLLKREINSIDKRNRIITLTSEGNLYAKSLLDELKATEIKAFLLLTKDERETVIDGFHLLSDVLSRTF